MVTHFIAPSKMQLPATVFCCLSIVAANTLFGYYSAPAEILLTPLVVVAVTYLTFSQRTIFTNPIISTLLAVCCICLNDIGVKLYGGGNHDAKGQGFIHASLFVGLLPAYGMVLFKTIRQSNITTPRKVTACLLFPILLLGYLTLFADLGEGVTHECLYGC
jgi:hypothetical protein